MSSLWLPTAGPLYLPPPNPVPRVLRTDEYVTGTDVYFHAETDRLLIVGHPYFDVYENGEGKVTVPKVSPHQYRVFRCNLPDPNKFALVDKDIYDPNTERLVWKIVGVELGRGGPLGIGTTGNPLFNKLGDTENPTLYDKGNTDERQNVSWDPKQTQLFIIGCTPPIGEYWDVAEPCKDKPLQPGDCPPIQLVNNVIQDGDMGDIGYGACNFKAFQQDRAGISLDLVDTFSIFPDFLKMNKNIYGDNLFFFGKREQVFVRHMWTRNGTPGDALPTPDNQNLIIRGESPRDSAAPFTYFASPSGSLNSSDSQIFNRPYWLRRAQGTNNGICWGNNLFVTIFDNTRGTNFNLSVKTQANVEGNYSANNYKQYLRHIEEFEFEFIFQLCKVKLDPDILAHINVMNPRILKEWSLAFVPPAPQDIEDAYRFIRSLATKCPADAAAEENDDPYKDMTFWNVDLKERFSSELSQHALGRKFLYQTGLFNGRKRVRSDYTTKTVKQTTKRKRSK